MTRGYLARFSTHRGTPIPEDVARSRQWQIKLVERDHLEIFRKDLGVFCDLVAVMTEQLYSLKSKVYLIFES